MRFSLTHVCWASLAWPGVADGAQVARTLVNRELLMNVNTIQQRQGRDAGTAQNGLPVSSMEYYADCDGDGDPYWLVLDIGTPAKNIARGSPYSFTIRAGDHPAQEHVDTRYPGGVASSPAGSPRLTLQGELVAVGASPEALAKLERCFLERHPDAERWLPLNKRSPHQAHWAKVVVSDVFMVGGFGDRAYIGPVAGEQYHAAWIHIEKT
ncbi:hypothetical protein METBIDRAFT_79572 [Metschnikowia bicuspidata var. bicuspidata NRRL YB-4993]|uniref:CREG-like beta-barrel domain-containing protein n=1 Tax=Metschnikowia bicuspidata var. bicuspidata NRRL YB-4993 TaxID=869754 RepID=A0A1A0H651_9ASCO|nr:hypothetical protein METBIDRAFT_79572 [Metschnikowia bicuspidata var. bicuspidata NRRL YB-4993]OBA19564.1 hypothetical protein METBIDRAFT_79572 [Metschnikowia bicuspidata var. bicuspidata NRRL YB-4993]